MDVGPKQQKVVSHSWIQNYDFFEVHIQLCCEPYFHLVAHSKRDLQGVFTKSGTQSQPLCEPFVNPLVKPFVNPFVNPFTIYCIQSPQKLASAHALSILTVEIHYVIKINLTAQDRSADKGKGR